MAEQVSRSIRANPETFEKLKAICESKGLKQGEAFEALLTAWEVQEAKGLIPERAADIADFDAHLQGIQKAFLRSLDLAQSAEARARISYAAQLDAMSGTITRLEKDLKESREYAAKMVELAQKRGERLERAEKRVTELEQAQTANQRTEALLIALEARLSSATETPQTKGKAKTKAKTKGETKGGNVVEFKAIESENGIEYAATTT